MKKIIAYTRVSESVRKTLEETYDVVYFRNDEYIDDPIFRETLKEAVVLLD